MVKKQRSDTVNGAWWLLIAYAIMLTMISWLHDRIDEKLRVTKRTLFIVYAILIQIHLFRKSDIEQSSFINRIDSLSLSIYIYIYIYIYNRNYFQFVKYLQCLMKKGQRDITIYFINIGLYQTGQKLTSQRSTLSIFWWQISGLSFSDINIFRLSAKIQNDKHNKILCLIDFFNG